MYLYMSILGMTSSIAKMVGVDGLPLSSLVSIPATFTSIMYKGPQAPDPCTE